MTYIKLRCFNKPTPKITLRHVISKRPKNPSNIPPPAPIKAQYMYSDLHLKFFRHKFPFKVKYTRFSKRKIHSSNNTHKKPFENKRNKKKKSPEGFDVYSEFDSAFDDTLANFKPYDSIFYKNNTLFHKP